MNERKDFMGISHFYTLDKSLVTTKPYVSISVATDHQGSRKKKKAKVAGALEDNENLMRKQRTELPFTVFC